MSISGFGRGKDEPNTAKAPPAKSGGGAAMSNLTAFIDQGSEFEGKLTFKETVRIDGRFSGEISSENTLIVGESGDVEASIQSMNVVISGSVHGDVTASRQVLVHKTGRLKGNVNTPSLVMEEGAVLNGNIVMGRPEAAAKAADPKPFPKHDPAK
jgi:cytoskeletal protein CcmA (bactofilin family)